MSSVRKYTLTVAVALFTAVVVAGPPVAAHITQNAGHNWNTHYRPLADQRYWKLNGNAITASQFLGSTNNQALNFRVNNARAFRLEPNATSPNLIGGFSSNAVTTGALGATIGGGGALGGPNQVTDDYGTVGGGRDNIAGDSAGTVSDARYATVGGGFSNTALGESATVGGGFFNTSIGDWGTVGGGNSNIADGGSATVGGGVGNTAGGGGATVGGGEGNAASGLHATVGGGEGNTASGRWSSIGGGTSNTATDEAGTVSGGFSNDATGLGSSIGGGNSNDASFDYSTVGGGFFNDAISHYATVGGGTGNVASGSSATVAGGSQNTAGGGFSFAAGQRAKANHQGAFVWGDSSAADMSSTASDQFIVRSTGGVYFQNDSTLDSQTGAFINTSTGGYLSTAGVWTDASSAHLKENFTQVDPGEVLARVDALPVTTWNYRGQDPTVRHIGPVAEDFHAAFGVGDDARHIAPLDTGGVALAAIQGLNDKVESMSGGTTTAASTPWLPWAGALVAFALCLALVSRRVTAGGGWPSS